MSSNPSNLGGSTLDAILAGKLDQETYNAERKDVKINEKPMEISSGLCPIREVIDD